MHMHMKLKKLQVGFAFFVSLENKAFSFAQLEEERAATIERDNRILLQKMSQIMRTTGSVDNRNEYEPKRF